MTQEILDQRIDKLCDALYPAPPKGATPTFRYAAKQLLTDVLEEVKPEHENRKVNNPTLPHEERFNSARFGWNSAIDDMEAKQRDLGL